MSDLLRLYVERGAVWFPCVLCKCGRIHHETVLQLDCRLKFRLLASSLRDSGSMYLKDQGGIFSSPARTALPSPASGFTNKKPPRSYPLRQKKPQSQLEKGGSFLSSLYSGSSERSAQCGWSWLKAGSPKSMMHFCGLGFDFLLLSSAAVCVFIALGCVDERGPRMPQL